MPGFVVTAVFVLDGAPAAGWKVPLGADVLAPTLRPGHRFSYCDGHTLSVVLELTAARDSAAFETALDRIEQAWTALGGGDLTAPTTLRLQREVPPELVPAGRPGTAAAREAEKLRALQQLRLDVLRGRADDLTAWLRGRHGHPDDDGWDDDGGLAGVREPRRPNPGPGHLSAERPVPAPRLSEQEPAVVRPLGSGPPRGCSRSRLPGPGSPWRRGRSDHPE